MKLVLKMCIVSLAFMSQLIYADSVLKIEKITKNVYAIIGPLTNRDPVNLGNNATFGFVVTTQGVVLIDSGGTYRGAENIHQLIKTVTDQPIVKVINTGGQDHRWFGNDYFKKQGAEIIASNKAVADHKARFLDQYQRLSDLVGEDKTQGTEPVYADVTFDDELKFALDGVSFELYHRGQAHTPGDIFVWMPEQKVMFTGDIVYVTRMLGVGSQSHSGTWIEAFEAMAEFKPEFIVPGHGGVVTLAQAQKDSYDYLVFLREQVAAFIDEGGELADISDIDMSRYDYLENSDTLSGRNTQQVFTEMEWE